MQSRRLRGFTVVPLAFCLMLLGQVLWAGPSAGLPQYTRLTILHTNDIHGHMFPFDYGKEENVGGVARRATLIDNLRKQSKDTVLVLDAGDVYTRGPIARDYMGEPDMETMNLIGYDCMTIGNNEFKAADGVAGQKNMFARFKQAKFPIVCANASYKDTGKTIVPPYVILERGGIKIGIFGLTAPRVATYPHAEGLSIDDPIDVSKKLVPVLKEQADVVIALTHIGYDLDKKLAAAVPDIDIIVGGDSHTWIPKPEIVGKASAKTACWVGGPVLVQDGEWAKCVGELDAVLYLSGAHDYQVMSCRGELIPVTDAQHPSAVVEAMLKRYTQPYDKVVGECTEAISREKTTAWLAAVYRKTAGSQIGIASSANAECGIKKGPVTILDLCKASPFANDLMTGTITGEMLEPLVSRPDLAVSGVTVVTSGERKELAIDGKPIDPKASYTVGTDSTVALYVEPVSKLGYKSTGKTTKTVLTDYVTSARTIGPLN